MSVAKSAYDATWGRLFASVYDRMLAASEEAGLGERRQELLAGASGRVVELGAGTGVNAGFYPDAVTELILTEPFEPMAKQLRAKVVDLGRDATVVVAPAERLPIEDASVETVVVTLVLCTVDDVSATLAEIDRVLKPGGKLLFMEHVRSEDPEIARKQDRFERPWKFIGHGCRCNRDTVGAIEGSSLQLNELERGRTPKAPEITKPLAQGVAIKPA